MEDRNLIAALGGPTKLARRLGFGVQRVSNWRKRGIPFRVRVEHPELFAVVSPAAPGKEQGGNT